MHLDHLYRETVKWDASVDFWQRLGFRFVEEWGSAPHRAGRMSDGTASVVLAEVPGDPAATTFLSTDDLDAVSAATGAAVADTHWGTRMVSLTDPDGRVYNIEPRSEAS